MERALADLGDKATRRFKKSSKIGTGGGVTALGDNVGIRVGKAVGALVVGDGVGDTLGSWVGPPVGGTEGEVVAMSVGDKVLMEGSLV